MTNKTTLLLLIFILFTTLLNAQTFVWADVEGDNYDMNPAMVNTLTTVSPDGTVWFVGLKEQYTSYIDMMGDYFLINYDSNGNRLNEYIIDGSLVINAIEVDHLGRLILGGEYYGKDLTFWDGTELLWQNNELNSFIARINVYGTVDWALNLNTELGVTSTVTDIHLEGENTYLAHYYSPESFISTIDDNGSITNIITQTSVGVISGFDIDSQGNFYLTGSCSSPDNLFNGVAFPAPPTYTKYLVKYNNQGIAQWVEYAEDVTCVFPKVKVDNNDFIYWAGLLHVECTFDTIDVEGSAWVYDYYITRYNSNGEVQWAKEVPEVTSGDASIGSLETICVLPDNSIAIGGFARGSVDWGNGISTSVETYNTEMFLINYDSQGDVKWAKTGGGDYYSAITSLDIDNNGNIYFSGLAHDTARFDNLEVYDESYYYQVLVKLEPESVNDINDISSPENQFEIYPNPASDIINLPFDDNEIYSLELLTSTGQKVLNKGVVSEINIDSFNPGLYFCRVTLHDGRVMASRFVVL